MVLTPNDVNVDTNAVASTERWTFWRGSPELFAHLVRVAARAVDAGGDGHTTKIVVVIGDDREEFSSPRDFVENVTHEALDAFESVDVSVEGTSSRSVHIRLERNPLFIVQARCSADTPSMATAMCSAVEPALRRGVASPTMHSLRWTAVAFVAMSLLTVAGLSAVYLILTPFDLEQWITPLAFVVMAVGGAGGAWFALRTYPRIEIAARGASRFSGFVRALIAIATSLALAALTKAILE